MSIPFPALKPIESKFTYGDFPALGFRGPAGVRQVRQVGGQSLAYSLDLVFLVTGYDSAFILDAYQRARGDYDDLIMPAAVFSELSTDEQALAAGLYWLFAEAPSVAFGGAPGWSRVTVRLAGERSN